MPAPGRRSLPDNLDPLVDTLSNVVGILVIVVALTQIQLGDALERVAELDLLRLRTERGRASVPTQAEALQARRDELLLRTEAEPEEAILLAREALEALDAIPLVSEEVERRSLESIDESLAALEQELDALATARERRQAYAERLQRVPKQMVARLPDPVVMQGRESWILVRYGRVYLTDREKLLEKGSSAIERILKDGVRRRIRPDEFESVAHYLRKRVVGLGPFRWALRTEPDVRAELVWRSRDSGIEFPDLASNRGLAAWLAERSPDIDFIQFHVWSDSFETYLAAREIVEAAGFRAGWRGHESDEELALGLRFGPADSPIGPVEVD